MAMFGNLLRATRLVGGSRIGILVFVTPRLWSLQAPRHPDIQLRPPTAQMRINSLPLEFTIGATDTPFPPNS